MTTDDSTQHQPQSSDRVIHFAAARGQFYLLHGEASTMDVKDHLGARLSQLSAMLIMIHGGGFDSFCQWSEEIQQNYLWACSMLADECKELVEHV